MRSTNHIGIHDTLKAIRKGNREAQFEIFGPGFHCFNKVKTSKKQYNRKNYKIEY
ncbi:hypothetical protein [uncultured Methanobrevibacter sp.]|uniref:hypothetical protein n=1 Tax=uncultured Methanobrevibacter sp. TaxID=253161 RepID=UPI0025FC1F93|nr:hypothetical protein [uncultured Methanobrevibacter sp.]